MRYRLAGLVVRVAGSDWAFGDAAFADAKAAPNAAGTAARPTTKIKMPLE
jgi:hypothetical protein